MHDIYLELKKTQLGGITMRLLLKLEGWGLLTSNLEFNNQLIKNMGRINKV